MESNCPFCNPDLAILVKETKYCRMVINTNQSNNSEAFMVIPKRHVAFLEELPLEERTEYLLLWGDCYIKLKEKFGREIGNMLLNEGIHAGQTIPHLHAHIFLRSEEDGMINMSRPDRKKINDEELKALWDKSQ